ncbi:hypothetical protein COCMIDRAFT_84763 [Bipolaris oryzae ATCC 44560]|uniref:Uncharacterized protein n=1 Tax=Bipolaris oryzae ATCC 44560 TaxID=930090 RepID=W6ZPB7_COCMI|nr:uncharacterized protein COCMIDRAFT_84763 [Bipolaris oryzae ATCC 44560]EUC49344.1 hypothetical protein COCMIDRAFT_84763 [Bipolaris oryzae ATCC 44560]
MACSPRCTIVAARFSFVAICDYGLLDHSTGAHSKTSEDQASPSSFSCVPFLGATPWTPRMIQKTVAAYKGGYTQI